MKHGCPHFAAIGVRVGSQIWAVSLQREAKHGLFDRHELLRLASLCSPLSDAASLSFHLGFQQVLGVAHAFDLIGQPAMLIDDGGQFLAVNEAAHDLLSVALDPRTRTLVCADSRSRLIYGALIADVLNPDRQAGPVARSAKIILKGGKRMKLRAIALRDWARFSFASARALLLFSPEEGWSATESPYRELTPKERKLAGELSAGKSLREAAEVLEIRYETARSYLKSIFTKTDTSRQGELVARILNEKYRP